MNSTITLTTDFGTRDGYVAQMKGVILAINPRVRVVDVTHDIEPFSILQAALVVRAVSSYFSRGTIHVVVVDPGVGGQRRGLVLRRKERIFIGPDNGLFSLLRPSTGSWELREIQNPKYMLPDPHPTFHGRDIFAPVAAHLSREKPFNEVGPLVDDPVELSFPQPTESEQGITGEVIYVDRFGNLTTNIAASMLRNLVDKVALKDVTISGLSAYFAEADPGQPVALINSFGYLEIAVNQGNACETLNANRGDTVHVSWTA